MELGSLALKYVLLFMKPLKCFIRCWSIFALSNGAGYEVPNVPFDSVGKTFHEMGVTS